MQIRWGRRFLFRIIRIFEKRLNIHEMTSILVEILIKNARCSGDANLECYLRLRAVRGQLYRVGDGKSRK